METATMTAPAERKQKRFMDIPPFVKILGNYKYFIMEELSPFYEKGDGKNKIKQLLEYNDDLNLRLVKHEERYFIYIRK